MTNSSSDAPGTSAVTSEHRAPQGFTRRALQCSGSSSSPPNAQGQSADLTAHDGPAHDTTPEQIEGTEGQGAAAVVLTSVAYLDRRAAHAWVPLLRRADCTAGCGVLAWR